jgi:hypothetical protein
MRTWVAHFLYQANVFLSFLSRKGTSLLWLNRDGLAYNGAKVVQTRENNNGRIWYCIYATNDPSTFC